jgi:hypothetical protein
MVPDSLGQVAEHHIGLERRAQVNPLEAIRRKTARLETVRPWDPSDTVKDPRLYRITPLHATALLVAALFHRLKVHVTRPTCSAAAMGAHFLATTSQIQRLLSGPASS